MYVCMFYCIAVCSFLYNKISYVAYLHGLRGSRPLIRQTRATAVCLQAKVNELWLELQPRLDAGPVCDAQPHWSGICGLRRYI